MKNFLKHVVSVVAPIAIQSVQGVLKGNPALNLATSIVQGTLMQLAGTQGITHEDASDNSAIRAQVQSIFDAMKLAGLVKPIVDVAPIVVVK